MEKEFFNDMYEVCTVLIMCSAQNKSDLPFFN